jgi:predicted kinase
VRINLDMLRTRKRERALLDACLATGQSFVVDNTHPARDARARYIEAARAAGFRVVGYYFRSSIGSALERNRGRAQPVPDRAVLGTHAVLELPTGDEGFDALFYVRADGGAFVIEPWRTSEDAP